MLIRLEYVVPARHGPPRERPNPVQYTYAVRRLRAKAEGRMGGIRLITALYTIFFVLIILIVIGSFFGVFENPLIDPGL
jgi:hypothetical protein